MGFFNALKRVLTHHASREATEDDQRRIRAAWGLDDEAAPAAMAPALTEEQAVRAGRTPDAAAASAYDRDQWRRRLRKILEDLPGSHALWHDLMTEAHALRLEPAWIAERQREEFTFLVRKAVSDQIVSEEEHRKLDHARKLMQMPEEEAEQILHAIVREAEAFFGGPVKEEA